jgi:hypothetical protein
MTRSINIAGSNYGHVRICAQYFFMALCEVLFNATSDAAIDEAPKQLTTVASHATTATDVDSLLGQDVFVIQSEIYLLATRRYICQLVSRRKSHYPIKRRIGLSD